MYLNFYCLFYFINPNQQKGFPNMPQKYQKNYFTQVEAQFLENSSLFYDKNSNSFSKGLT